MLSQHRQKRQSPQTDKLRFNFAWMMMQVSKKLWFYFHKCGIIITHVVIVIHVGYSRKLSNVFCITVPYNLQIQCLFTVSHQQIALRARGECIFLSSSFFISWVNSFPFFGGGGGGGEVFFPPFGDFFLKCEKWVFFSGVSDHQFFLINKKN
jgi:hypothetical protein